MKNKEKRKRCLIGSKKKYGDLILKTHLRILFFPIDLYGRKPCSQLIGFWPYVHIYTANDFYGRKHYVYIK